MASEAHCRAESVTALGAEVSVGLICVPTLVALCLFPLHGTPLERYFNWNGLLGQLLHVWRDLEKEKKERLERIAQQERERAEKEERERVEKEKQAKKEKEEKERQLQERLQKLAQKEREKLEKEEKEKEEKERKEREEKERKEKERKEREEKERVEREEKERLEKEKKEKERLEKEEKERNEKERKERERVEKEEKERKEKEKVEKERKEKERKEKGEKERKEKEERERKEKMFAESVRKIKCVACQFENSPTDAFCAECGASMIQQKADQARKEQLAQNVVSQEEIVEPKASFRVSYVELKDASLLDILNAVEFDVLSEAISDKKEVGAYFSTKEVVAKLIYYLLSANPIKRSQYKPSRLNVLDSVEEHLILYKIKHLISDLFVNFDAEKIFECLSNNKDLLATFLDYLSVHPKEPNTFHHFNRLLYHLVDNAFHKFVLFYQSNKSVLGKLVDNIESIEIRKVILLMLQKEASFVKYTPQLQWSKNSLIPLLSDKLKEIVDTSSDNNDPLVSSICEFLSVTLGEVATSHPYLISEVESNMMDIIDKHLFGRHANSFHPLVCSLLPYNPLVEKSDGPSLSLSDENEEDDSLNVSDESKSVTFLPSLVTYFSSERFHEQMFKKLCEEPRRRGKPVLGMGRWRVLEMVHKLVTTSNDEIEQMLVKHQIISKFLDLFFTISWNNVLHTSTVNMLVYVLHNKRTETIKNFVLLEYQLLDKLLQILQTHYSDLKNPNFEIENYVVPKMPDIGFAAHLIQIANEIQYCYFQEIFPPKLLNVIKEQKDWNDFALTCLPLINEICKWEGVDDEPLKEEEEEESN